MTAMFWPVMIFMAVILSIGLYTYTQVRGSSKRYTVCEKSMPFIVIGTALVAQAVDGNATLGNTSLTFVNGVWAGALIPIGLGLSLFLVGTFLAKPLNRMNLLTLPEFFYRRYGKGTEALVSCLTILCFTVLIAGNLSAVGWILSVVTGLSYTTALLLGTSVIVTYTIAGGLYSAIWTDFVQVHVAIIGFVGSAAWIVATRGWGNLLASVPAEKLNTTGLVSMQAGALSNWAGMIALAIGNAMALDFMERVFAAKSPETARNGCYYAGFMTFVIGFSATILGIASISSVQNVSDSRMVLPTLAAHHLPYWLGAAVMVGVLGCSMSTSNGATLVISIVLARNVIQRWSKRPFEDHQMLTLSRAMAIPTGLAGALVAWLRPEPGILLVIAFDIVFAGCVVPLFMGVYWKRANAHGAVAAILAGTTSRALAYFLTPPALAGLDTLLPPVISLIAFFAGCRLGWATATESELPERNDDLLPEGANG